MIRKDPRSETFCETLKTVFCPLASIKQFIVLISIVDVAVFIASLAYDALNPMGGFLAPSPRTLLIFGEKVSFLSITRI